MSDNHQLRLPATAAAARKPRKPSDDDKQRERKRALDRKAQRTSREKTKSYIKHLEKLVQILSEKNGSGAADEMMEEMGRLHAEIDRLRKIIDSIKSVLGTEIFDSAAPRQTQQFTYNEPRESADMRESRLCEVESLSDECSAAGTIADNNWGDATAVHRQGFTYLNTYM